MRCGVTRLGRRDRETPAARSAPPTPISVYVQRTVLAARLEPSEAHPSLLKFEDQQFVHAVLGQTRRRPRGA
jgi:hypothetical protein